MVRAVWHHSRKWFISMCDAIPRNIHTSAIYFLISSFSWVSANTCFVIDLISRVRLQATFWASISFNVLKKVKGVIEQYTLSFIYLSAQNSLSVFSLLHKGLISLALCRAIFFLGLFYLCYIYEGLREGIGLYVYTQRNVW